MGPSCATYALGVFVRPSCATYALLRVWGSLWGRAVPHTRCSESGDLCGAELRHICAAQGLGVSVGPSCATYALGVFVRPSCATYALLRVWGSLWGRAVPHTRCSESGDLCGAELRHIRAAQGLAVFVGPSCATYAAQGLGVSVGPSCATHSLLRVWGSLWGRAVPHTHCSGSGGLCESELCHTRAA